MTPHLRIPSAVRRLVATFQRLTAIPIVRVVLALLAVAVALWLVRDQLQQISLGALLAALRATPPLAIALSALFTCLSFACLAVVEAQALKIIGRPQPAWRVAIASFASNAVSIVMGFGVVSGAAVRLRTYAFARMKPSEIGRLVVLMQAATVLSGVVALGMSLLRWLPRALAASPDGWLILGRDVALLAPAALWFVLFRAPPGGGQRPSRTFLDRLIALAAGLGDWVFSGAALFVLSWFVLSPRDVGAFSGFMSVFCLGSLIGSVSGVPGGLGILEAVMLGLQTRRHHVHETAAALILYRAIYFLGPLVVTGLVWSALQASKLARRLVRGPQPPAKA